MASPMPVLPLVASITVCPGWSAPERETILDRAERVEGFDLDVEIDVRRREPGDLHDRRVADRAENVRKTRHEGAPVTMNDGAGNDLMLVGGAWKCALTAAQPCGVLPANDLALLLADRG